MDPNATWKAILNLMTTFSKNEQVDQQREDLAGNLRDLADWVGSGGAVPFFREIGPATFVTNA